MLIFSSIRFSCCSFLLVWWCKEPRDSHNSLGFPHWGFQMYSSSLMYTDTHNYSSLQDCYDDIQTCKTNKQTNVRSTIISSSQGYYLVNLFLVFSPLFGKSYMKLAKRHINIWHQLVRTTLLLPLLLLSSFLSTCVLNCKINFVWTEKTSSIIRAYTATVDRPNMVPLHWYTTSLVVCKCIACVGM